MRQTYSLWAVSVGLLALAGCASEPNDVASAVDWARAVKPVIEDRMVLQQQRELREEQGLAMSLQLNAAEEKKIPYAGLLNYPANWPAISAMRDGTAGE